MWSFFNRKVCLTLGGAEYAHAETEFRRVGLYDVQKFTALKDIGPHQSFNNSTRAILTDFYNSTDENMLFLEDDVEFKLLGTLSNALQNIPDDWDLLYLGANIAGEDWPQPVRVNPYICKVPYAWATHAVAYRKPIVKHLLDNQPGASEQMYDNFMAGELHKFNCYIVTPMVAIQRPRFSNIWERHCDYSEVWKKTDEKLAKI